MQNFKKALKCTGLVLLTIVFWPIVTAILLLAAIAGEILYFYDKKILQ